MTGSSRLHVVVGLAVALAVLAPSVARADNDTEAEQLFRDGKKLMKESKYAEACDAFDTSNRLSPAVTTLINLADCREKNGQIATAWTLFIEVQRQTRGVKSTAALAKTAKDRAQKLEPRLSYMTVSVPAESNVEGLALSRNGEPFDPGLWNRALPVDGGTYVIGGKAPGHEEWSTTVTVPQEKGSVAVDVPKFKEAAKVVPPPDEPPVGDPGADPTPVDKPVVTVERRHPSAFTGKRKLALGLGAVGLLGVGGGILFGLQANGFNQDAEDLCPNPTSCAKIDEANALVDKANRRALYATISYGVAGVAVIGAAVLWFTGAPHAEAGATALTPVVGPRLTGLALTGSF